MAEGDVTSQDYQEFLKVHYYTVKPLYIGQNDLSHEAIVSLCRAIIVQIVHVLCFCFGVAS